MSKEYEQYEIQVMNRVAHSIGCLPSDMKEYEYLILEMHMDGLTEASAARAVENSMQGECYYYTNLNYTKV